MVRRKAMIRNETRTLRNQLSFVESNVAWKWQIERLQSELATLKNILIDAGILVNINEHGKETIYLINGETFSIRKGEHNANT
jgi:hypothetical protein